MPGANEAAVRHYFHIRIPSAARIQDIVSRIDSGNNAETVGPFFCKANLLSNRIAAILYGRKTVVCEVRGYADLYRSADFFEIVGREEKSSVFIFCDCFAIVDAFDAEIIIWLSVEFGFG